MFDSPGFRASLPTSQTRDRHFFYPFHLESTIDLVVDPVNTGKTSVAGAVRKSQTDIFFHLDRSG